MGAEGEEQPKENGVGEPRTEQRLNPISDAQFQAWKRRKDAETSARKAEAARKRAEDIMLGTTSMNGRELFQHEPWVFDNSRY